MSAEMDAIARLAPGTGLLARRDNALLYAPERDAELVEAFVSSAPGSELQAMASTTVAAGFGVGPFVCLAWGVGVQVMAFGDVAVETDQPSLPMLSGAGSRTWVEHSFALHGSAVIEVAGAAGAVDDATDLTAGVALAGGFRLELVGAKAGETATPPEPAPSPAVAAVGPDGATEPGVDATTALPLIAEVTVEPLGPEPRRAEAPERERPARPAAPPTQPAPEPRPDDVEEPDDLDMTLPPPAAAALLGSSDVRSSLVDAKRCGNGHPNPPTAATCEICGDLLAPGTASIAHVPRPSLGRLALDDGGTVELDQELLIGRNPDRDSEPARQGLRRVKLVGEKVSRSHLEIRFQGWEILVADCGSTNGTFVVPHPGGQVATLEPGHALMVGPGATIYFGSRSFTVVGRHEPRP
ncbi:MAG: FHA domain-containing protein [Ilumatobacteraceae bacterium]